jgi:hypothetical protein
MPSLTIEDRTSTGDPTGSITLPDVPDGITLRELIRLRVREEVARFNLRPLGIFTGLIGSVDANRQPIDWQRQADTAIALFEASGYVVLVNGVQVTDLETRIRLREDLVVRFVRLTPLVGS